MTSLRQHLLHKAQVTLTPEQRYEARMAMRGRGSDSAEDHPEGSSGSRFEVFAETCPSCGHPLHGIHRVRPNGAVDERAVSYHDDANEAEEVASKRTAEAAYKSHRIQRPGSRGGTFHVDAAGNVVYDGDGDHGVGEDMIREMGKAPGSHWLRADVPAGKVRWGGEFMYHAFKNDDYTKNHREPANTHPKEGYFNNLEKWYLEDPSRAPLMLAPEDHTGMHSVQEGFHRNHIAHYHGLTHIPALIRLRDVHKSLSSCPCCGDHAKCDCGEDCAHCDCNRPLKKSGVDTDTKERGVMVALYPSPKVARSLAIPGGEDPKEIHLTLGYLGKIDDLTPAQVSCLKNAVKQLATKLAGFELQGRISGLGYFQQPGSDQEVLYASVDVPGLNSVYEWLLRKCREKGLPMSGDHGFTAHCTLSYQKKGTPRPKRATPLPEVTFTPDSLVCKLGAERHTFTPGDSACPDCGFEDCKCVELSSYNKSLRQYVGRMT